MECLLHGKKGITPFSILFNLLLRNELGPDGIFIRNKYGRIKKGGDVPLFLRFYHY